VCQEVCPPSNRLRPDGDRTEAPPAGPGPWVDVLDLLDLDDVELLARFGRWYIPRREPRYLRRNALVVLGNTAAAPPSDAVRATLHRYLFDPDPLLRAHAVWTSRRLGADDLLDEWARATVETDAAVLAELAAMVPVRAGSAKVTLAAAPVAPPTRRPPSRRLR